MRTRMKKNVGKGRIQGENVDTETNESILVPNTEQGSANDLAFDAEKADRNKDGKVDSYERTVATRMLENMRKNA
jgi:hypothetical protein